MVLPQALRRALTLGLVLALSAAVSGCGRRGSPEFVSEDQAAAARTQSGTQGLLPASRAPSSEPVKPQRAFLLDPLL